MDGASIDLTASAFQDDTGENIKAAQDALIRLGFDLGASGADGDWGQRSQMGASEWKKINGYKDETSGADLSVAQLDLLAYQGAHPETFERKKAEYTDNLFAGVSALLDHLDPVRASLIMQHTAHLGAQEQSGNTGAAVEQYVGDVRNAAVGLPWCAAYGTWAIDQLESYAGLEKSEFMDGDGGVKRLADSIEATQAQAVKSTRDYTPQPGDALLIIRPNGTGHYATVLHSVDLGNHYTRAFTIEGNANNAVSLVSQDYYTDPETGEAHPAYQDTKGEIFPLHEEQIKIVDISALPNYDRMSAAFNRASDPFVPTPSGDSSFAPDLEQIAQVADVLKVQREEQRAKTGAPVDTPAVTGTDPALPKVSSRFTAF